MKVVLDTNVLLVSLPSHSPFHPIYQALLDGRIEMAVTNEILAEYEEQVGHRLGVERTELHLRELLNLPNMELLLVYFNWNLISIDPDDNKFVDCAVAASADYLVTNDRHFSVLNAIEFPPVNLIRAEDFLKLLQNL